MAAGRPNNSAPFENVRYSAAPVTTRLMPYNPRRNRDAPGSVASLEKVKIGGVDQWILLRGVDAETFVNEAAKRLDAMDADSAESDGRVRVALTPHAPHTTSPELLRRLVEHAGSRKLPLSIASSSGTSPSSRTYLPSRRAKEP